MGGRSHESESDSGIRILVVDGRSKQSAAVRKALKAAPAPFLVSPARRLWSAVQILAGMSIDAVLLGQELGDSADDSALEQLREQAPHVPVLVLGDEPHGPPEILDEGADDYLGPGELEPNMLALRILDAIERRRPAIPTPTNPTPQEAESPSARILLVEDDHLVQRLLRRNLERNGYLVEVVSSPQEALAWSQKTEQTIDLLICDDNPPGMEGVRLSNHLKKQFREMLTLLVSGARNNGDRSDTAQKGVQGGEEDGDQGQRLVVLPRPYSLEDFAQVVNQLLTADRTTRV